MNLGVFAILTVCKKHRISAVEQMCMLWHLVNVTWFQTGCDVLSGLFQVMPNLSDDYNLLNERHKFPLHHPERIHIDVIYWFELVVEIPLGIVVLYLYLTRNSTRYVVEAFLHGMHLTGAFAYYVPGLILGETTHVVLSNIDRAIASLWVIVPVMLLWRAARLHSKYNNVNGRMDIKLKHQ